MTDIFEDPFNYEESKKRDEECYAEFKIEYEAGKEERRILEERMASHSCDYPYANCPICYEYFCV